MAIVTSGYSSQSDLETAYGKVSGKWSFQNALMTLDSALGRSDLSCITARAPTYASSVLSDGSTTAMYGSGFCGNVWTITQLVVDAPTYKATFLGRYVLDVSNGTESGYFNKIVLNDDLGSQGQITINGLFNVNAANASVKSVVWSLGGAELIYFGNASVDLSSFVVSGAFSSAVFKYNGYTYSIGNTSILPSEHFATFDQFLAAKLAGNDKVSGTANGDYLYSLGGNDTVFGGDGEDDLDGGAGNDSIDGGRGGDTLIGGSGNDTYVFGRGYGADTVQENDATLGNIDTALFSAGISTSQLWMRQVGNDLEVSIIGTSDKLTFDDWYLGEQYCVEQFKTADNKVLLDSQVDARVQAMAQFTPPAFGQTTLSTSYQAALTPVIAANWH